MSEKAVAQIVVTALLFVLLAEAMIEIPNVPTQFYSVIIIMYLVSMLAVNHIYNKNNGKKDN